MDSGGLFLPASLASALPHFSFADVPAVHKASYVSLPEPFSLSLRDQASQDVLPASRLEGVSPLPFTP